MRAKIVVVFLVAVVISAGVALGQTEWVEHPDNPVIGPAEPGEWDSAYREVSGVVFDGSTYHLYFNGYHDLDNPPSGIGHATSSDGVTWTLDLANPVLTPGADGEWDEGAVADAAVMYDNADFHMWYGGWIDEWQSRPGYATSPDGSSWTKFSGNPLFERGGPGSFDESGVFPGSVVFDEETYRMWYTGVDLPDYFFTIGYAESSDGISWTKHPGPVLETGSGWDSWDVSQPSVIFDGSIYHMWYSGAGVVGNLALPTGIGHATSADGIEWAKYLDNPVLDLDESQPTFGCVVFDGSAYQMWYTDWVFEGPPAGIAYATSDCCVPPNFRQVVPAAALASGAQGSFYQTDVDVSNPDDQAVEYEFSWLPRGEDNSDPVTSEGFTLGAGMSARYANVLSEVFGLEPDSLGALLIWSSSPDLLAMSRTYNLQGEKAGGTFGQSMPAFSQSDFIQHGETRRILFGSENADMRTNIGCQNGTEAMTVVYLDLYNAAGTSLGRKTMILKPLGNDQVNRIFDGHNPVNGCVDVSVAQPGNLVYCYGSVLDNVTSDPTTIPPQ